MSSRITSSTIKKAKAKGIAQQMFGWIITLFCGLITSVGAGNSGFKDSIDVVLVTIFAIFTALGIRLIMKGEKRKKLIKNYYDYSARLYADPDKSIDSLSSSVGAPVAVVTKNISDMIALGFFPGAFLDTDRNRIVMINAKSNMPQMIPIIPSNTPAQVEQTVKHIAMQCKGCGATNKIVAEAVNECEFCGSQISGN